MEHQIAPLRLIARMVLLAATLLLAANGFGLGEGGVPIVSGFTIRQLADD